MIKLTEGSSFIEIKKDIHNNYCSYRLYTGGSMPRIFLSDIANKDRWALEEEFQGTLVKIFEKYKYLEN